MLEVLFVQLVVAFEEQGVYNHQMRLDIELTKTYFLRFFNLCKSIVFTTTTICVYYAKHVQNSDTAVVFFFAGVS